MTETRAAVYCRISRDAEGRRLGVDRQLADCRAHAQRLGWTVVGEYVDNDISASRYTRKKRPEFTRLINDAKAGLVTGIVAYSTSRLTRRPREFETLVDLAEDGLAFTTVNAGQVDLSTASGRVMARVLAAFDAHESDTISERARRERQQRRERGMPNGGGRAFGFEADRRTPRPAEQELLRQACRDVLAGRSLRSIAKEWDAAGVPSPAGAPTWRPATIGDCLRRHRMIGQLPGGEPACWDPVVTEDVWHAVRAVLNDPARRIERGEIRLLTGIARCGHCGSPVNAGITRHGKPTIRCSAVRHLDRAAEPVEDHVADVVLGYLAGQELRPAREEGPTTALATQVAGLRARLDEAAEMFAEGEVTRDQLTRITARLTADLETAEARLAAATGATVLDSLPLGLDALRAAWDRGDQEWRRRVLRALDVQVVVHAAGRGAQRFDPATVAVTMPNRHCV